MKATNRFLELTHRRDEGHKVDFGNGASKKVGDECLLCSLVVYHFCGQKDGTASEGPLYMALGSARFE